MKTEDSNSSPSLCVWVTRISQQPSLSLDPTYHPSGGDQCIAPDLDSPPRRGWAHQEVASCLSFRLGVIEPQGPSLNHQALANKLPLGLAPGKCPGFLLHARFPDFNVVCLSKVLMEKQHMICRVKHNKKVLLNVCLKT